MTGTEKFMDTIFTTAYDMAIGADALVNRVINEKIDVNSEEGEEMMKKADEGTYTAAAIWRAIEESDLEDDFFEFLETYIEKGAAQRFAEIMF